MQGPPGQQVLLLDRSHDEAAQAADAKDAISRIVSTHEPAMQDQLAKSATFVEENRSQTKKPAETFRLERIDHAARCLGGVIATCLHTAWVMTCEPPEP